MEDKELKALLQSKIHHAMGFLGGELSAERQQNLDYYLGERFGNEEEGHSTYVSRDVEEIIEWTMPALTRIFLSGQNVAVFEPVSPEDEQAAQQETDYVNHVIFKENDGFLVFYDWFKDALISKNAYVKVWWDDSTKITSESYENLTDMDLAVLDDDEELEAVEQEAITNIVIDGQGMEVEETRYNVKYRRTSVKGKLTIKPLPPEEVLIDASLESLNLDEANFVAHRVKKTVGELIAMGFDAKVVDNISSDSDGDYNDERVNRRKLADEFITDDVSSGDETSRAIWLYECYIRVDYDYDDYPELRRVLLAGDTILENEETDHIPIVALSPYRIPHKHIGLSQVDLVKDLQLVKSTLMRQTLDNLYKVNNPRQVIKRGGVNLDDLLSDVPGHPIRVDDVGNIQNEPIQPVINHSIAAIQFIDEIKERRTGVSRLNMGANPDILAKSTRGAFMGAMEQANQIIEMIARMFAETGVRWLMRKTHELLIKHHDDEKIVKLRGQWMPINPKEWKDRTDMTIVVGTGTANDEQKLNNMINIMQVQERIIGAGGEGRLVSEQNIYNAARTMAEAGQLKDADLYFTNPQMLPPPEPDPQANINAQIIQLQSALGQAQIQMEAQKTEIAAMKNQTDAQLKAAKQEQDFKVKMDRIANSQAEHISNMEQRQREHDDKIATKLTELELEHEKDVPGSVV